MMPPPSSAAHACAILLDMPARLVSICQPFASATIAFILSHSAFYLVPIDAKEDKRNEKVRQNIIEEDKTKKLSFATQRTPAQTKVQVFCEIRFSLYL
jgi:hypothetical protein